MKKQTVAITGASGYVGWNFCRTLVQDYNVIAVIRSIKDSYRFQEIGIQVQYLDMFDENLDLKFLKDVDIVIHAAAKLGRGSWDEFERINIRASQRIAEESIKYGVSKFIYISSIEVYKDLQKEFVLESEMLKECGQYYSDSKIKAEKIILHTLKQSNISCFVLRVGMIYGPGSMFWSERLYCEMLSTGIVIVGNGKGRVYPVYIRNLVNYVNLLCKITERKSDIINIVDFNGFTWNIWLSSMSFYFGIDNHIIYKNKILYTLKLLFDRKILKKPYSKFVEIYNREAYIDNTKYLMLFRKYSSPFCLYDEAMKMTSIWLKERENVGHFYET